MKKTLIFGSGAAVGYITGAKAGTQRYQQIISMVGLLGERTGLWRRAEPAEPQSPTAARSAPAVPPDAPPLAATPSREQLSTSAVSTRPPAPQASL